MIRIINMYETLLIFLLVMSSFSVEITELCPYNAFCNSSPLMEDNLRPWRSCCMPCSCEPECVLVGTCCPDRVPTTKEPVFKCRSQSELYKNLLQRKVHEHFKQGYRVVDRCQSYETQYFPKRNTSQIVCNTVQELGDLKFATSMITGITYLNKHCAICNNDPIYSEWQLQLIGTSIKQLFSSLEERDEYIFSTGNIRSVTNSERILRLSRCEFQVLDKCNVTERWDFYDKELEEKCAKYNMNYYTMNIHHSIVTVKNPFCYLCNMPFGTKVEHSCDSLTNGLQRGQRESAIPFSAILRMYDLPKSSTAIPEKTNISCKRDEIFDPLLNYCSRFMCPPGMMALWGKCEPLLDDVKGYVIAVVYKINMDSNEIHSALNTTNIFLEILNFFKQKINSANTNCGLCVANIYGTLDDEFILKLDFVSTEECQYLHLLRQLSSFFRYSVMTIDLSSYPYHVNVSGVTEFNTLHLDPVAYYNEDNKLCLTQLWYKQDMIHCPSIVFKVEELKNIISNTRNQQALLAGMTELDNGEARICLEDYRMISVSSSGVSKALTRKMEFMFICYMLTISAPYIGAFLRHSKTV